MGIGTSSFRTGDGDVYTGDLLDGVFHGFGRLVYSPTDFRDRLLYEGAFVHGQRHGFGKLVWRNGTAYMGSFRNDQINGYGLLCWQNGMRYEGEWKESKFHGNGTLTWKSGKEYTGTWAENRQDGCGKLLFPATDRRNRVFYQGDWKMNVRHGNGMMMWTNGAVYIGEWVAGKRNGFGEHRFPSGDRHIGQWCNGRRWGAGRRLFLNGDCFQGHWENDKKHGVGLYTYAHGRVLRQRFEHGRLTETYPEIQSLVVLTVEFLGEHDELVKEQALPDELLALIHVYRANRANFQQQQQFLTLFRNGLDGDDEEEDTEPHPLLPQPVAHTHRLQAINAIARVEFL